MHAKGARSTDKLIRAMARGFARSSAGLQLGLDADDLYQEGQIALWLAARTWRGESSLWTYARRFVQGAMFDCFRRQAGAKQGGLTAGEPLYPDNQFGLGVGISGATSEGAAYAISKQATVAQLEPADSSVLVREMLATLSPRELDIVAGYVLEDETLRELGEAHEMRTSSVQYIRDAGLRKMRAHLEARAS